MKNFREMVFVLAVIGAVLVGYGVEIAFVAI